MPSDAQNEPLQVEAMNGDVVMTGPRVAVAFTPPAAKETARRLTKAAKVAEPKNSNPIEDDPAADPAP